MTVTTDVTLLCAAIDVGDYTAISALADAMEEAGDSVTARGLRRINYHRPARWGDNWTWACRKFRCHRVSDYPEWLPPGLFFRVARCYSAAYLDAIPSRGAALRSLYSTRSAAIIALAKALCG